MFRTVMIVVALAILAAAGVVEGVRSGRFGESDDQKASRLQNVPCARALDQHRRTCLT